jgi:4-amino-4-deoxy-L-arabinose transferase-like glycosyltransferase
VLAGSIAFTLGRSRPAWLEADLHGTIVWAFIALHVALWTTVPHAVYANVPLDSVEMHAWGQEWEWGYHKHPPLPAWLTRVATVLAGGSPIGIYLAAQLCMGATFAAAWRLGRELVAPQWAVLATVLLECCLYYNYEATVLNNNTLLYPLWAWAIVCLYLAVQKGRLKHWLGLGACVGLGLLTKYTMGILVLPMMALMALHPAARGAWRRPGPYVAAATALAIASPHLAWAVANDFPTLAYASSRVEKSTGLAGHAINPLRFLAGQGMALLPIPVMAIAVTGLRWKGRVLGPADRFGRDFLAAMVLGPFGLYLLLSMAFNLRLRNVWGCQLWTFAPLALLFFLKLRPEAGRWWRVVAATSTMGVLFAGALVVRTVAGGHAGRAHRELFPGRELARQVEAVWDRYGSGPLPAVAGEGWLAGNVAFYGESGATVYGIVGDVLPPERPADCGWMNDRRLAHSGGVYLWPAEERPNVPSEVRARFPTIEQVETLTLDYPMDDIAPERVGVAVIPVGSATAAAEGQAEARR